MACGGVGVLAMALESASGIGRAKKAAAEQADQRCGKNVVIFCY